MGHPGIPSRYHHNTYKITVKMKLLLMLTILGGPLQFVLPFAVVSLPDPPVLRAKEGLVYKVGILVVLIQQL